jgi:hypothetical protein
MQEICIIQNFGLETSGKSPCGRPRQRLADNIELELKEIGYESWYWIVSYEV